MKRFRHVSMLVVVLVLAGMVVAQDAAPAPATPAPATPAAKVKKDRSPIAVRQRRVERLVQELKARLEKLAQSLIEKQPEQAKRLKAAFQRSNALRIEERMREIAELLEKNTLEKPTLEDARAREKVIIQHLKELVEILLKDDPPIIRFLGQQIRPAISRG